VVAGLLSKRTAGRTWDPRMDEDAALMVRTRQGDKEAFALLVERYRVRAVSFAYRLLGDRHTAEDMAQEAFVRAYSSRHRYRPRAAFSTWFYRILSNICLNEIRRRGRRDHTLGLDETGETSSVAASPSADEEYRRRELAAAARRALDGLPGKQRLAVILQRFEGMDYAEIAEVMGLSRGAVDGLLSRAREALRRELSDYL